MILRNLAARLCYMVMSSTDNRSPSFVDMSGGSGATLGNVNLNFDLSSNLSSGNTSSNSYNGNMNALRLCLGSGTTTPTFTDYALETPVNMTNLTLTSGAHSASNCKYTVATTLQNTGDSDFTFSEIVLAGFNNGCKVAFTRDVISPVTIPAGGSKTITIVIDFASMATSVA